MVSYPSLRRFVLNGFTHADDPIEIVSNIQKFAPSLTHLCLPCDPGLPLLSRLKTLMDEPKPSENVVFPMTLELLLVHDRVYMQFDGITWSEDPRFVTVGRAWENARGRGPLERQWEYQWFDGIRGGPGFWHKPVNASAGLQVSVKVTA
jgi:hypothetical protein